MIGSRSLLIYAVALLTVCPACRGSGERADLVARPSDVAAREVGNRQDMATCLMPDVTGPEWSDARLPADIVQDALTSVADSVALDNVAEDLPDIPFDDSFDVNDGDAGPHAGEVQFEDASASDQAELDTLLAADLVHDVPPLPCIDECEVSGKAKCWGSGWRICGDEDGDGCLEWGPLEPCLKCLGGQYGTSGLACVKKVYPSPTLNPKGLDWDGTHFWLLQKGGGEAVFKLDAQFQTVDEFDLFGEFFPAWGIMRSGDQLLVPAFPNKLQFYSLDGQLQDEIPFAQGGLFGLTGNGQTLWVARGDKGKITQFNLEGEQLQEVATVAVAPYGITAFKGGFLVSDYVTQTIVWLTPEGSAHAVWPSPGPYPTGIASNGEQIWVADGDDFVIYELEVTP